MWHVLKPLCSFGGGAILSLCLLVASGAAAGGDTGALCDSIIVLCNSGNMPRAVALLHDHPCKQSAVIDLCIRRYINAVNSSNHDDSLRYATVLSCLTAPDNGLNGEIINFAHRVIESWDASRFELCGRAGDLYLSAIRQASRDWASQFSASIELYKSLGYTYAEAEARYALGEKLYYSRNYIGAYTIFKDAIDAAEKAGVPSQICRICLGMANSLLPYPDSIATRLSCLSKAMDLAGECRLGRLAGDIASSLAHTYYTLGDYRSSASRYGFADSVYRDSDDFPELISALGAQGLCYSKLGDRRRADSIYNLAIELADQIGDTVDLPWLLIYKADYNIRRKDTVRTRDQLLRASVLLLSQDIHGYGTARYQLGRLNSLAGKFSHAKANFLEALSVYDTPVDKFYPYKDVGNLFLDHNEPESALVYLNKGYKAFMDLRISLPRAELKQYLLEGKEDLTAGLVRAYCLTGNITEALAAAEDFRSWTLREQLASANHSRIQKGSLSQKHDHLQKRITELLAEIRECKAPRSGSSSTNDQLVAVLDSTRDLTVFETSSGAMDTSSSFGIDISIPQSADTLWLYYFVSGSYLSVWYNQGPDLAVEQISSRNPETISLVDTALDLLQGFDGDDSEEQYLDSVLTRLGVLLPQGVANKLDSVTNIVIFPYGKLAYLPFEAIRIDGKYLIESAAISYSPSLSIRHLPSARKNSTSGDAITFIGYDGSDEQRGCEYSLDGSFAILQHPGAMLDIGRESRVIREVYEGPLKNAGNGRCTEEMVKAGAMEGGEIIHFAAHGLFFDEYPQLSCVVLAANDTSGEDGYLTMDEIARLRTKARLVVLSSCQSAHGRQVTGEGIVGIARSFFLAGAGSLLTSLFPIHDRVSNELMREFYRELNVGSNPSKALQSAKLYMLKKTPFTHPYYWSAFIIIGR